MTSAVSNTPTPAATTPAASSSASTPSSTGTGTDAAALDQNFNQFLSMLTTQLQNQDPLNPMDTAQFTQQLVMFSQVEQQLKTNSTLSSLLSMQSVNTTALGVSFIGKDVQAAGSTFTGGGGSTSALAYSLPTTAAKGTIAITDANGNVVFNQPINLATGTHDFSWNGTNLDGTAAPAGTYTLTVSALDASGNAINTTGFVPGRVTSLETADDGTLMLNVNNNLVPMTDVREVSSPAS